MLKLLVVDDEPGICDIIRKTFSPTGFTVLMAYNGKDAVAILKKEKPKLVFLDIRMLGMSGMEVLKEIKQFDSSIKVLVITALDDEKTRNEALSLGADEFITKPFMSDYLEEVVRRKVNEIVDKE